MIRQTDYIRTTDKCFAKTRYPCNEVSASYFPVCVYLSKYGKCELNCCVKNIRRGDDEDKRDGV